VIEDQFAIAEILHRIGIQIRLCPRIRSSDTHPRICEAGRAIQSRCSGTFGTEDAFQNLRRASEPAAVNPARPDGRPQSSFSYLSPASALNLMWSVRHLASCFLKPCLRAGDFKHRFLELLPESSVKPPSPSALRRKQQDRDSAFIFEIYGGIVKAHRGALPATALYMRHMICLPMPTRFGVDAVLEPGILDVIILKN